MQIKLIKESIMEHLNLSAHMQSHEKRAGIRQKSFTGGHIHFNRGNSTYETVVRNVSATGAKLKFAELITLPAEFELKIGHDASYRKARVAWRHGFEIGIAFTS
jgi:hypothetical protein